MSNISDRVTPKEDICCFSKCDDKQENLVGAGILYKSKIRAQIGHEKKMTANCIEMAKVVKNENLLVSLSYKCVA